MIIGLDFDGTTVTHEYPEIGKEIGAAPVLKELVDRGHKIVLNTMRSGEELQEAVDWFQKNKIPLYGINENPDQKEWTSSPKVFADLYIDDAALGAPLSNPGRGRPFIDWRRVRQILALKGLL